MLENMINYLAPKRCKISDIGNAVLDNSDCVMLKGERETGERPVECVKMMRNITSSTENYQRKRSTKKQ
jgi:pyruvate kinase